MLKEEKEVTDLQPIEQFESFPIMSIRSLGQTRHIF